jgi:glycosyltransferase involved in cell wall biosynthesis
MSQKKKLLVCMPDFPFPARKNGISIRYYPILEQAAKKFNIHLLIIAEGHVGEDGIQQAKVFCDRVSIYVRKPQEVSKFKKLLTRIKALVPYTLPFDMVRYDEQLIARFIEHETQGTTYDNALCVLLSYQHLVKKFVGAKHHSLDLIDSPYSTSLRTRGNSLIKAYDAFMMKLWERKSLNATDYSCYVSPLDRKLGAGNHADENRVGVIPNGLFLQDHSDEKIDYGCHSIGYLGHMGYTPNIRAALRLYRIFKAQHNKLPNTKLIIIGRDPAPEICALAQDPDVIVTGTVDNIWPYINGVDVFAFPMEIGSGQQNKLLEAMGAGKAVISSTLGNSGIGAKNQYDIIEADSDDAIGSALVSLTNDKMRAQQIGTNAKTFIDRTYSWPSIFTKIDSQLLAIE